MDALKNMWYNFVLLITQPTAYFEDKGNIRKRFIEAWLLGSIVIFTVSALQTFRDITFTQATFLLQLAIGAGLIFLLIPLTIGGWTALFYSGIILTRVDMTFAEILRVYLKTFPLIVTYWAVAVGLSALNYIALSGVVVGLSLLHIFWLVGLGVSRHEENKVKAWVAPWITVLLTALLVTASIYVIEYVIGAPTY